MSVRGLRSTSAPATLCERLILSRVLRAFDPLNFIADFSVRNGSQAQACGYKSVYCQVTSVELDTKVDFCESTIDLLVSECTLYVAATWRIHTMELWKKIWR